MGLNLKYESDVEVITQIKRYFFIYIYVAVYMYM